MLKICNATGSQGEQGASFLSPDPRKKQVTVFDPTASGYMTSANRRAGAAVPKMFAFDSVYTPDDSLTELCAGSLTEILQAVVAGADGCLFTYGYSKLGKTYTMTGSDQSPSTLGIMPCAIAWLFKLINEQKDKTGARFSVRVSAVQVTGKEETLRDLLIDIAQVCGQIKCGEKCGDKKSHKMSGDLKSGDLKSGDLKSGDLKSGDLKSSDLKSGDLQGGDLKSGDLQGGDP
ncbi:kinesin protein KIF26A [Biomphalaria glabrata]|nr:kinesin protein KIF26A [Biomphalaria glabrata]